MLNKRILVLMFVLLFLPLVGCFPPPTNQAPIITSSPITAATVGVLYTYDVNATDPDGDTLTYLLVTKPKGMAMYPKTGVINWTPTSAQLGNNQVSVKVSDGTLSVIQNFTIKVSTLPPANQAPVIYSTPVTTATVGVTYFYDVNATDPNGDTLTYSLTAYPSGMAISSASGLIMWTPTAEGAYAVIVNVSDGALSDTQGFTILVSKPTVPLKTYTITASAGPGGFISPLGDVTVSKGANIVFNITPNTNYNIADVLVDGGSVGAMVFYTFINVAKDHTIHATFSEVGPEPEPEPVVNRAPTITSTPITIAIMGVTYSYDVDATDPDGDVLTYSLTTKPAGMAINPVTGIISWIPTAEGSYGVIVEVSDGGLSDSQGFTIIVSTVEITGIEVEPDEMTLFVGGFKTIESVTATYVIKKGLEASIPLGSCTYASSAPSKATVSDAGVVTGVNPGGTTITVTYTGKTDKIVVTVLPPLAEPVHNITQDIYYATIQGAINFADPDDVIEVAAGTYNERITIEKALTIKSTDGAAQTIIDITGLSVSNPNIAMEVSSGVSDLTISGFTIKGSPTFHYADESVMRLSGDNDRITISNNVINGVYGIIWSNLGGGHTLTISDNIFIVNKNGIAINATRINVVISDNTIGPGTSMIEDPSGIYATNCDNLQITGNTITNMVGSDGKGQGIMVPRGNNVVISGNTITGNGMWGIGWWSSATSYSITNNVISNNGYGNHLPDTRNDGINIEAGTDININNNNIVGNAGDGIDSLVVVDATNNWWGSEFGPKHNGFPVNGGDSVSDNVDYAPWSITPH